jgi:hypothetical protein
VPARLVWLEANPAKIQPALSVQTAWNHGLGIQRGLKKNGLLHEDCITEDVVEGRIVPAPAPIIGTRPMRAPLWSVREHRDDFLRRRPPWQIRGAVGNANLLCNPFFVACWEGRLYRLATEAPLLEKRLYTCLVAWANSSPRVSIEPLRFTEPEGKCRVYSTRLGREITPEIELATFGQQIVRDGQPIRPEELTRMVVEGQFYDLRHRFLFGRYEVAPDRWLDIGIAPLHDEAGGFDTRRLLEACEGKPLRVDLSQFDRARAVAALTAKGYTPADYTLDGAALVIKLKEGIYPHNLVGIRKDGTVIYAGIEGLSNRVGITLTQAAELMAGLGAEQALVLDNGNDVFLDHNGQYLEVLPKG